jgi:type VI secretion system secreted protein Hcp
MIMPADYFLKIDGIDGESTDDKHKSWIEVLSFSHGLSQRASASQSSSGGGTTQRADFIDLSVVKLADSSTPKLFLACAKGDHIKEVILECCRAGGDKLLYLEIKMSNVVISAVQQSGGGEGEPVETVTFNYGKVEWTYTKQKRADGSGGGNVPAGWNLETNAKV